MFLGKRERVRRGAEERARLSLSLSLSLSSLPSLSLSLSPPLFFSLPLLFLSSLCPRRVSRLDTLCALSLTVDASVVLLGQDARAASASSQNAKKAPCGQEKTPLFVFFSSQMKRLALDR